MLSNRVYSMTPTQENFILINTRESCFAKLTGRICIRKFTKFSFVAVLMIVFLTLFGSSIYMKSGSYLNEEVSVEKTSVGSNVSQWHDAQFVDTSKVLEKNDETSRNDAQELPEGKRRKVQVLHDAQPLPVSSRINQSDMNNQRLVTKISIVKSDTDSLPLLLQGGQDPDDDVRKKRDKIKEMMVHAWSNYGRYAWGYNELKPVSRGAHRGVFPDYKLGLTIVDSLDTLYIMGMDKEFKEATEWVKNNLDFNVDNSVSLFETTIRYLGGLLSAYALTGNTMFKDKAVALGDKLMPAFNSQGGIPYGWINLNNGARSGSTLSIAEAGTLHMEFSYLSSVTGDPKYQLAVARCRNTVESKSTDVEGLYPQMINAYTSDFASRRVTLGAGGDSFYEYLLKTWIQSGYKNEQAYRMYAKAENSILNHMVVRARSGLTVLNNIQYGRSVEAQMEHLACFVGGMLAQSSKLLSTSDEASGKRLTAAEGIAETCHESYKRSPTGLGPEQFGDEARSEHYGGQKFYILRPEVIETYFVLWRTTHDKKYRDWAWEAVQAIEKYCRTPNGYSGIKDVNKVPPELDDVQQSFFLAETLKYLYLIFSSDELIADKYWVFTTEAHPFPIAGINPLFRLPKKSNSLLKKLFNRG